MKCDISLCLWAGLSYVLARISLLSPVLSCLIKLGEYVFAIPDHNANVERIFSLMSTHWSDERTRLSAVQTIEAILICHVGAAGLFSEGASASTHYGI